MAINTNDPEFERMITDKRFQSLSKPQQLQMVNEYKQQKRMIVPKSEGFLQNAIKSAGGVMHDINVGTRGMVNTATMGGADLVDKMIPMPPNAPLAVSGEPQTDPGRGISGFINMMTRPGKYHENIIEGAGGMGGFMAGAPGQIFQAGEKLGAKIIPNYLGKTLGRAVGGGASGFSAPGNLEERKGQAVAGSILGPVIGSATDVIGGGFNRVGKFVGDLRGKDIPKAKGQVEAKQADIKLGEEKLSDLVTLGPGKVKATAKQIHGEFQKEFGTRLDDMKWNLNGGYFQEAFEQTARDLGGAQFPGSPGSKMTELAEAFAKKRNDAITPKEAQSFIKSLTEKLDLDSAVKLYRNFTEVLSRDYPEFAQLKSDYAPIYDILEASKIPNKGVFRQVASDQIGPEGLAKAAEAEQTVGIEPSLLGETSEQGARVRGQKEELGMLKNKLQELIGKQKGAKKRLSDLAWQTAGIAIPGAVGLGFLKKILK